MTAWRLMNLGKRITLGSAAAAALLLGWLATVQTARAIPEAPTEAAPGALVTKIMFVGKRYAEPPPLSLLDKVLTDEGLQGARLAIKENNMTGRLVEQHFELVEVMAGETEDIVPKVRAELANGHKLIVADLEPSDLLAVADLAEAKNAVIFNARSSSDDLRQQECRVNVFHITPNWAMRADALAQYLIWKKWRRWLLVYGTTPGDKEYVAAIKRAAQKFGAKIVEERPYEFDAGSRRTDSGHQQIQTQMPLLTQGAPEYDVIFVSDVGEAFGDYLMFRTYEPRPVVGSQGLQAVAWHRSFEQYAGTQLQNRFEKQAKRVMTERDYTAWLGVRVVGEAVTRTAKNTPEDVNAYILSKDFEVAGFKGLGLTFRSWDHQMRQPILLSGPRALVSISPQEGFLHQKHVADTLGFDEPETKCRISKK
ncbi:MAG: ABC transporter substrate-binding protein [Hyphomicrobium zavarzinii]|uniref:ABC transporter substrate-binding protein n=1 Tax=Hyphomicrobium zavarzinii TaxID=48292 RepID=UPI001A5955DE|nr:ABC transporter substrate-binding protein [Hyphomicrobium zavarzinii]MBL8846908.1 ABC transporter substrate-binding protein [Hyphomicrobium zavarzinii]